MTETKTPTLEWLHEQLRQAKADEASMREIRLQVEQAILTHPDVAPNLKAEGTCKIGGFSIATGYTRDWDQAQLKELRSRIRDEFWPFLTEFKENRKVTRLIEEKMPEFWQELRAALTLRPKKPAVTIKALDPLGSAFPKGQENAT